MKNRTLTHLWLMGITAGILWLGLAGVKAQTPSPESLSDSAAVQRLSLTPQERLQLRLMKAEYNNLALSLTIKGMQIQEWIRDTREGKGLGPEYLLDEADMMYKPTEVFDDP